MFCIRRISLLVFVVSLLVLIPSCNGGGNQNNSPSTAKTYVTSVPILFSEQDNIRNLEQTPDGGYLFMLWGTNTAKSVIKLTSDGLVDWRVDDVYSLLNIRIDGIKANGNDGFYYYFGGINENEPSYGLIDKSGVVVWEYIDPSPEFNSHQVVFFKDNFFTILHNPYDNTTDEHILQSRDINNGSLLWERNPMLDDPVCSVSPYIIGKPSSENTNRFTVISWYTGSGSVNGCPGTSGIAQVRYRDYDIATSEPVRDWILEDSPYTSISSTDVQLLSDGSYLAFGPGSGVRRVSESGSVSWQVGVHGATYNHLSLLDAMTPGGYFIGYSDDNGIFQKYDLLSQNMLWEYKLETYLDEDLLDPSYLYLFRPSFIATNDGGLLVLYVVPDRDIVRVVKMDRNGGYPDPNIGPANINFEDITFTCSDGKTHDVTLEFKTQACKQQQATYTEIVLCERESELSQAKLDCLDICGRLDCYEGPTHYLEEE